MPVLFTDLLKDPAFDLKNRNHIKELYSSLKTAVKENKLNLEGHTLPDSLNDWIRSIEGDKKIPKTDTDVVNFSLAEDKKYENWRKVYLLAKNPIFMSQSEKELVENLQDLESASNNSLSLMNGTKDDVVAALSDLQAAVSIFLSNYDKNRSKLKLPDRLVALERVQIQKPSSKKAASSS
jgi:hypothetical protein